MFVIALGGISPAPEAIVPQSSGSGADDNSRASITGFVPTTSRLCVTDEVGGPSRVRIFDHHGKQLGILPAPPISAINDVVHTNGDDIIFHVATYLSPPAWYSLDAASGKTSKTALAETSPAKFDDAEVVREFAVSKDGTRVLLNIIRRRGTRLDGLSPTLLTAYGGYGISLEPHFVGPTVRLWLESM